MKRCAKYLIASAVALVLSILCALISLISLPDCHVLAPPEDAVSQLDSAEFSCHDCEMDADGTITPTGNDPQIVITGVDSRVSTFCVRLAQPVLQGTRYQLYFAGEGEPFSESHSVSAYSAAGQLDLVFELEPAEYERIRLDVDGSYVLSDVLISQSAPRDMVLDRMGQLLAGNYSVLNGRQWIITLAALWVQAILITWQRKRLRNWVKGRVDAYRAAPKRFWLAVLRFLAAAAASMLLWGILCAAGVLTASFYTAVYFLLIGCVLGSLLALYHQLGDHPERVFAVLILSVGLAFALLMPRTAMVSWDDETHYRRALDLSYCGESWYTGADLLMQPTLLSNEVSLSNAQALETSLNDLYEQGCSGSVLVNVFSLSYLAYLPSAAAVWLARALGLSFTGIFVAGRVGSVICYAVVLYFAMKRLKGNGLLIGLFGLLPTMIFIASNYSYDGWCLSFLALGTAVFLDEYRHPERPITWQAVLTLLGALMIGCIPKAIYFPIFLMGLFLPREKFRSDKERRICRVLVVACAVAMALTFVAPFLFNGGSTYGDTRGGSDVNAAGQVAYILADPIRYAKLLLRFLFVDYFNPANVLVSTVSFLAYMGQFSFGILFVVLVALVYIAERPREDVALRQPGLPVKLAAGVSFFCAVCLAATAMYVSYTPVGHVTINGCQWRYMMPVLLPMLMQVRPNRTWMPIPKRWFHLGVISLEGILLFAGLWPLMASYI